MVFSSRGSLCYRPHVHQHTAIWICIRRRSADSHQSVCEVLALRSAVFCQLRMEAIVSAGSRELLPPDVPSLDSGELRGLRAARYGLAFDGDFAARAGHLAGLLFDRETYRAIYGGLVDGPDFRSTSHPS